MEPRTSSNNQTGASAQARPALESRGGSRIGKSLFSLKSNQNTNRSGVSSVAKVGGSLAKAAQEDVTETAKYNTTSDEVLSKRETESNGQSGPSTGSLYKEASIDQTSAELISQMLKNEDEDYEFEEATVEVQYDSYLDRVTKDFD